MLIESQRAGIQPCEQCVVIERIEAGSLDPRCRIHARHLSHDSGKSSHFRYQWSFSGHSLPDRMDSSLAFSAQSSHIIIP